MQLLNTSSLKAYVYNQGESEAVGKSESMFLIVRGHEVYNIHLLYAGDTRRGYNEGSSDHGLCGAAPRYGCSVLTASAKRTTLKEDLLSDGTQRAVKGGPETLLWEPGGWQSQHEGAWLWGKVQM